MGCVYYRWQLVSADLINNDKLFIVYCDWLYPPDMYFRTTPASTLDYSTNWLIYCSFIFDMLFQSYPVYFCPSMLTHYMHVHLPLYFYTLIWSSDSLNLHIQVYVCYLTNQAFGEDRRHLEESEFFYLIVLSRYLLTFIYSYCFHDFMHLTQYLFYSFISILSLS